MKYRILERGGAFYPQCRTWFFGWDFFYHHDLPDAFDGQPSRWPVGFDTLLEARQWLTGDARPDSIHPA